jgi:hypothetical protein
MLGHGGKEDGTKDVTRLRHLNPGGARLSLPRTAEQQLAGAVDLHNLCRHSISNPTTSSRHIIGFASNPSAIGTDPAITDDKTIHERLHQLTGASHTMASLAEIRLSPQQAAIRDIDPSEIAQHLEKAKPAQVCNGAKSHRYLLHTSSSPSFRSGKCGKDPIDL